MGQIDPRLTRRSFLAGGLGVLSGATAGVLRPTGRAAPPVGEPPASLKSGAAGATAPLTAERSSTPTSDGWYVPADHVPHERTWMAWPAREDVWGGLLGGARADVASVAQAIARYEPVSMVARPDQAREAGSACGPGVDIVELVNDDLWMRDMGPIFVVNDNGGLAGIDLNFNGWGRKQVHSNDAKIAREVLGLLGLPRFDAPFVSEGGALEVDGHGTAMATESSIIEPDRNPGKTKAKLTVEICAYLGVDKVVWVPGLKNHDITDDHIDGLARFVKPGLIVVDQPANPRAQDVWAKSERQALRIFRSSTDARGRVLECLISRESKTIPPGGRPSIFVNVYVNWYVCNGAVLIPSFDDPDSDAAANRLVAQLYPDREVVQLRIDTLAEGGGGIHCATQQQPAVPNLSLV